MKWAWISLFVVLGAFSCQKEPAVESVPGTEHPSARKETAGDSDIIVPTAAIGQDKPSEARSERRTIEGTEGNGKIVTSERQEMEMAENRATPTTDSTAEVARRVRSAVLAGGWYEGNARKLEGQVTEFLSQATSERVPGYPIGLIVPHAGYRYSGKTAAHAYRQLTDRTYDRVFILGPSHRVSFRGVSVPKGVTHYETPLGLIEVDTATIEALAGERLFMAHPTAHKQEHSLEIQLPFIQALLPGARIVPMLVSGLTEEDLPLAAEVLKKHVGPGDLVVASSDFTHYGSRFGYLGPPEGQFTKDEAPHKLEALMQMAWEAIAARDIRRFFEHKQATGDTICGFLPIALLLSVLPQEARAHKVGSDTSGNLTGDYRESVSYLAATFTGLWPYSQVSGGGALTSEEKNTLLSLARATVEKWVLQQKRFDPKSMGLTVTPRMLEKNGAFVTLKIDGRLRGCIGTIQPVKSLVQAVTDNSIKASWNDRRFNKVTRQELALINVEVSVLTPPIQVAGPEDVILGRHGVIVEKDGRSAVYLPQVAPEQGWTLPETLSHLSEKAGLNADGWRQGARFHVFEAIVFHEPQ